MFPMLDTQLLQPTPIVRHSNSNVNLPNVNETSSPFPFGTPEAAILVLPTTTGPLNQLELNNSYTRSPLSCLVSSSSVSSAVMQYPQRPSSYSFNQHISSWMAGLSPPQALLPPTTSATETTVHIVPPTTDTRKQQPHYPARQSPRKQETETGGRSLKAKRHSCTDCLKSFHRASDLVKHQRTHTGEKPFVCPHCSRAFSDSSSLSAHKRIHTGERPYRCNECSKAFAVSSSLVKHRRTHTGEKPYQCLVCGRAFSDNSSFAAHKKRNQPCSQQTNEPVKSASCVSSHSGYLSLQRTSSTGKRPKRSSAPSAGDGRLPVRQSHEPS